MAAQRIDVTEKRPLDILGISEPEERTYRWLLMHPGATVHEIAQALPLSARNTQRLLDMIEAKGLATHSPERPRRYIPAAPDMAMDALILQRQKDLQKARIVVDELQEQAKTTQRHIESEQIVEVIMSPEAEQQVLEQIQRAAQHEIVTLTRSPLRISRLDESRNQPDQQIQRTAQARGVRYRGIVDSDYLTLEGAVGRVRADIKAGEQVRVYPHLPFKLVLVDRRIAIIPLKLQQMDSPVLLVRPSALLDALYALFEMLWKLAAPISFTRAGVLQAGDTGSVMSKDIEDMVSLMAAGLNDKAIAYDMHISVRTLRRHIVGLMKGLDARTRFQAGWLAAIRLNMSQ